MAELSERASNIKPSPTLAVTSKAAELRAAGKNIIGLGAGEPDFDTPEHIKQAAKDAIDAGQTKYTAVDGTPELKAAIQEKFQRDNQLSYKPEQILVSCGGKQSFFNLSLAWLNPGDEVIIPAPYWVSYPDMVRIAEAKPVIIQAGQQQSFKVTPEQLEAAITPKTKLFVINSPSNPTGVAYTKAELAGLADVLLKHPNILIATDDMYEHILWADEPFSNIVQACPELYERCMVLNGVSKAYSMTGWRIGYAAGPADIIKAMKKIQSQSTSNPCSISQVAATEALSGDQGCIKEMTSAFKSRHDSVLKQLNAIPGFHATPSDGTFYLFPNVEQAMKDKKITTDIAFSEAILEEAEVALVPGSAFGLENHVRLSYATSQSVLDEAITRLNKYITG